MLSIALLGAGRIGQIHGKNVVLAGATSRQGASFDQQKGASEQISARSRPGGVRLAAIADPLAEAAESLAGLTGAAVQSPEAIFADPEIDAVIIATPTDTHAEFIHSAAAAGKAIFCEKPVDMSAARISETLAVVEKAGVPLMIGFNRRFDPNFAALRQRLDDGAVGEVELVTILSRDPAPPPLSYIERSGGLFRDMMIHDFDMARFLLGEEVVEVQAMGSALVDPAIGEAGDVDTAAVILRTAAGRICQISNSRRAPYGYDQRIEVHGSKGMLSAGNVHETTVRLANAAGVTADPVQHFFLERYAAAYQREIAAFIEVLDKGAAPSPNGHDGLMAQMLADAATEACFSGKPVKVG